jgi:hypothetical protein
MADKNPAQAIDMIKRTEMLCDYMENTKKAVLALIPVTMPADPGSLGFDASHWVGLGTVGIWAALDAYAERADMPRNDKCPKCERKSCIWKRFESYIAADDRDSIAELEDIRHLYAHNFAGNVDAEYSMRGRHFLRLDVPRQMTCGVQFNGRQLLLNMSCLRFYSGKARKLLEASAA